jgi:hypothetical protein
MGKGGGYSLKVILVPVDEVADTLGSGDTRLVKEILRDKKKMEHFQQLEVKRPFVFTVQQPAAREYKTPKRTTTTTSPSTPSTATSSPSSSSIVESEIAAVELKVRAEEEERFRTVPQCVKQLLQPNDFHENQKQQQPQPAAADDDFDDGDRTQTSCDDEHEKDDTTPRNEDEGGCFNFEQQTNIVDMGLPQPPTSTTTATISSSPSGKTKKKKKQRPSTTTTPSSKYDFENDSNDLDDRIGYKYMYALEAIVAHCPSARYLKNDHDSGSTSTSTSTSRWTNFRSGFISDVQVHAFKTGIDLDWHQILERGVPDSWNAKKQFPQLLDYPTV